jgi:hypothetical protein
MVGVRLLGYDLHLCFDNWQSSRLDSHRPRFCLSSSPQRSFRHSLHEMNAFAAAIYFRNAVDVDIVLAFARRYIILVYIQKSRMSDYILFAISPSESLSRSNPVSSHISSTSLTAARITRSPSKTSSFLLVRLPNTPGPTWEVLHLHRQTI